jgi:predicted glycogen debranching enzyme
LEYPRSRRIGDEAGAAGMSEPLIRIPWPGREPGESDTQLAREWLLTNGLGGYASGTLLGIITRRYHGYLIAALPAPFGRVMMFNDLVEHVELPSGKRYLLGGEERAGVPLKLESAEHLSEFRLEAGLPVWRYELEGAVIEKRLVMPHLQNSVYVNYRLVSGVEKARLMVRPSVHFRPHDEAVNTELDTGYVLMVHEDRYEIALGDKLPALRFLLYGSRAQLTVDKLRIQEIVYRIEERRGYPARGDLWSAGYFNAELRPDADATLVASTDSWECMSALGPADGLSAEKERRRRLLQRKSAENGTVSQLLLAADQFLITPAGRVQDVARARAVGNEVRTLIAGYHWFTDWGRDTMISLEGITLSTGRFMEAAWILKTFAHYIRDGLIPNLFPEGKNEGLYHTADATLWFFHAIDRYTEVTDDHSVLEMVLPKLVDIFEHHMRGTRFGIGVDPGDGLLTQGAEGYALTWMDAKVDNWVVTPRRGKAVEINALWYNALCLLGSWLSKAGKSDTARRVTDAAKQAQESFNRRFWSPDAKCLFDVVDGPDGGDDPACRPNQLLAISLKHPVLNPEHWKSVVEIATAQLLTPFGLRSLSPEHKDYKPKYDGDLRSRDAAYHQGTVWAWLIGPFIDAWLKVHPEDAAGAKEFLKGFASHFDEACLGTISEIFDAEAPYTPRGCVAQAWSVAEVLRCWLKLTAG